MIRMRPGFLVVILCTTDIKSVMSTDRVGAEVV